MNVRLLSVPSLAVALSVAAINPLSAAVQAPTPISQVAPAYLPVLRASCVEGEVVVSFTIKSTGDVANPMIVSSTDRLLEKPTLEAVRKWKFAPPMNGGVAVNVKARQTVEFMIPELHPDARSRLVTAKSAPARATTVN
jgi:TonB family protein